jgi:hypothetical protein
MIARVPPYWTPSQVNDHARKMTGPLRRLWKKLNAEPCECCFCRAPKVSVDKIKIIISYEMGSLDNLRPRLG